MSKNGPCLHVLGAVCWRCSDQVPWWREARIKAGITLAKVADAALEMKPAKTTINIYAKPTRFEEYHSRQRGTN